MESLWQKTVSLPRFETLEGEHRTQVLIIGGGLAGLLCAYRLQEAGVDCLVLEAGRIASGVSGHTTAKVTSQHGLCYDALIDRFGVEKAGMYLEANEEAVREYRRLASVIPCDWEDKDAYVYTTREGQSVEYELMALERLRFPATFEKKLSIPLEVKGAVRFPRQGQLHPLKLLCGIAAGLPVYEHSAVRSFDGNAFHTDRGRVFAEHVIVATHFPLFNKHGAYFLKLHQHRSYVLALKGVPAVSGMYVDEADTGLSFRQSGDYLLVGGGAHRTGEVGGGWQAVEHFICNRYPDVTIEARWAAQDCMSLDGVPYIGKYARGTPRMYVATGFNKWGLTSSMVAARLLCDRIVGRKNPYAAVFSPSRRWRGAPLMVNAWTTAKHMLTPTSPRCPHMGCALQWNAQEHSWDCACHGSRFSESGKRLDGPANGDARFHKS